MGLRRHFTEHPASVGESYGEHFRHAAGFTRTLAKATVACAVHAVVPSMCERTASTAICDLHARMTAGARGRALLQQCADDEPRTLSETPQQLAG